jgi:ribokinase
MSWCSQPSGNHVDILTVSDMCVDLILNGNVRPQFHQVEQLIEEYELELGGSANIFATQFAKLGGLVGVIGCVGEDLFGDFALDGLQTIGVDTSRVKRHANLKTGLGVALSEPNDRAILTYLGTIDAIQPSDLPEATLDSCRHWHITSFFLLQSLMNFWFEWVRGCKARGVTVSLDPNWDPDNRWQGLKELLPFVDVFFPNEAEAMAVAGCSDLVQAGTNLASYGPLVVVKCGHKGAIAFKGGQILQTDSISERSVLPKVADSVGAGDNFDAGFIRAWLLGKDVKRCLALANRCAVASLSRYGGIKGQLNGAIEDGVV